MLPLRSELAMTFTVGSRPLDPTWDLLATLFRGRTILILAAAASGFDD